MQAGGMEGPYVVLGARGSAARSFSREPGDPAPLRKSLFPQETTEGTARAGPADVTAAQAVLGGTAPSRPPPIHSPLATQLMSILTNHTAAPTT